jgi:hypothetical protein
VAALRDQAIIGLDIGKTHHWVCVLDGTGKPLLSRKIANDGACQVFCVRQVVLVIGGG